jgi:hypothetical protein
VTALVTRTVSDAVPAAAGETPGPHSEALSESSSESSSESWGETQRPPRARAATAAARRKERKVQAEIEGYPCRDVNESQAQPEWRGQLRLSESANRSRRRRCRHSCPRHVRGVSAAAVAIVFMCVCLRFRGPHCCGDGSYCVSSVGGGGGGAARAVGHALAGCGDVAKGLEEQEHDVLWKIIYICIYIYI